MNEVLYRKYAKVFNSEADPIPLNGTRKVVKYTYKIDKNALSNLDLRKSISWDCIPRKSYKKLLEKPSIITALTDNINDLVKCDKLPTEVVPGRLFCLNKNWNVYGN